MTEKWIVERGENTYWVCDGNRLNEFHEHPEIGMAYKEKHAHLFAASPLMLEALEAAFAYVLHVGLYGNDYHANNGLQCPEHEEKLAKQLKAAIAAAKGE